MADGDEVTNGELARRLEDIVNTMKDFSAKAVIREVYEAHRLLFDARIQRLEEQRREDVADRATTRKLLVGGVITLISGIIVQVLTLVIH